MAHSLTPDGTQFTLNGVPIEGVRVEVKRGRYRYVSEATGKLLASGMSPEDFARRYWFASEWHYPENSP